MHNFGMSKQPFCAPLIASFNPQTSFHNKFFSWKNRSRTSPKGRDEGMAGGDIFAIDQKAGC